MDNHKKEEIGKTQKGRKWTKTNIQQTAKKEEKTEEERRKEEGRAEAHVGHKPRRGNPRERHSRSERLKKATLGRNVVHRPTFINRT